MPTQLSLFDSIEVPLTKGYVALIDPVDADLMRYRWCVRLARCGLVYAERRIHDAEHKSLRSLHCSVLARTLGRFPTQGECVDHIDGNGLNNRRNNLRLSSQAQNSRNRRRRFDCASGYKGVRRQANSHRWEARIMVDGKSVHLGMFDTPQEAHAAYCDAAHKYHGEFARTE